MLTREGQLVLHTFAKAIAPAAGGIEQVNIMSHTAKVTELFTEQYPADCTKRPYPFRDEIC